MVHAVNTPTQKRQAGRRQKTEETVTVVYAVNTLPRERVEMPKTVLPLASPSTWLVEVDAELLY